MTEKRILTDGDAQAATDEELAWRLEVEQGYATHHHPIIAAEAARCVEIIQQEIRRRGKPKRSRS